VRASSDSTVTSRDYANLIRNESFREDINCVEQILGTKWAKKWAKKRKLVEIPMPAKELLSPIVEFLFLTESYDPSESLGFKLLVFLLISTPRLRVLIVFGGFCFKHL